MTLESKIKSGEFAVIGEFEPPKGADLSPLINNANRVRAKRLSLVDAKASGSTVGICFIRSAAFRQEADSVSPLTNFTLLLMKRVRS